MRSSGFVSSRRRLNSSGRWRAVLRFWRWNCFFASNPHQKSLNRAESLAEIGHFVFEVDDKCWDHVVAEADRRPSSPRPHRMMETP
jgi:hypothetical protein